MTTTTAGPVKVELKVYAATRSAVATVVYADGPIDFAFEVSGDVDAWIDRFVAHYSEQGIPWGVSFE